MRCDNNLPAAHVQADEVRLRCANNVLPLQSGMISGHLWIFTSAYNSYLFLPPFYLFNHLQIFCTLLPLLQNVWTSSRLHCFFRQNPRRFIPWVRQSLIAGADLAIYR